MKKTLISLIIIIPIALALSSIRPSSVQAQLGGVDCMPCANVVASAVSAGSSAVVAAITGPLLISIETSAAMIKGAIYDSAEANRQITEALAVDIAQIEARRAAFDTHQRIRRTFGDQAGPGLCDDGNRSKGTAEGELARRQNERDLRESVRDRNQGNIPPAEVLTDTLERDPEEFDAGDITDPATPMDADRAQFVAERLTDFSPPAAPTEAQLRSPAGMQMESVMRERQMRLSGPSAAFSFLTSEQVPSFQMNEFLNNPLGNSPTLGVARETSRDHDGNITYRQLVNLLVESRSPFNSDYPAILLAMTGDELNREIVRQISTQNILLLDISQTLRHQLMISASQEAREVNENTRGMINQLRRSAATLADD